MPNNPCMSGLAAACESCGKRLPSPDAVVCTNCGFDTRTGKRVATRLHRLKEKGLARRRARASAGRLWRWSPWLFLLVQIVGAGVFAYLVYLDPALRALHAQVVFWHVAAALGSCTLWMIYEEGPIALFYPTMTYMVLFGDDANPWVESLLFGAGANFVAHIAVLVVLANGLA